jgi:hypothetical protein
VEAEAALADEDGAVVDADRLTTSEKGGPA